MPKTKEPSATIRALRIIDALPAGTRLTPNTFATELWPPDDPRYDASWRRVSKVGTHGSTRGVGMWRAGGGFLGKLKRQGLIQQHYINDFDRTFWLTPAGEAELKKVA